MACGSRATTFYLVTLQFAAVRISLGWWMVVSANG